MSRVPSLLMSMARQGAKNVAADPDARAYINAVRNADGGRYMEVGVQRAIDAFVIGCKADGIWGAIKAGCILAGARTLAGALTPLKYGAELWTAPTPAITSLQGASGSWNAATKTMSSLTTGTSATTPRFNFNLGLVAGVRYEVSGRLSGDTALVGSVRLGTSLLTYNSTTGEISGTIAAVDSTLAVYFNSTQGPASASIVSLSVMEDWTPTNNGPFVAGDYNRKTGLVGNGTTKDLDTNRNNNADPQNSKHLAVFLSERGTSGPIGNPSHVSGASWIFSGGGSNSSARVNSSASSNIGVIPASGFVGASRSAAAGFDIRHSATTTNYTDASVTPVNQNIRMYRASSAYGTNRIAFYSIGESLNLALLDARVTALYNAIGAAIP